MSYSNRFSFFLKIKSITQHQSSSFIKKIISLFFIGVAILILCVPIINAKIQVVENFFDDQLSSVHHVTAIVNSNIKEFKKDFFSIFFTIKENTKLRNENKKLKVISNQLANVMFENKELKLMNNFIFPNTKQILSTRLILRSNEQIGTAKILAGQTHGVQVGQFVVTSRGTLLGRIISTSKKAAKVLLITEPKSNLSVRFPRINNKAILSGNYNDTLKITFTKTSTMPINGDVVVTSGDDGYLPAGLLVGTVVISENKKERAVVPIIDPKNIDFVSILEFEGKK
jgi:rod shape-determining protein MreC